MEDAFVIDKLYTLQEILEISNINAIRFKTRLKLKYIPDGLIIYCTSNGCPAVIKFLQEDCFYRLIENQLENHDCNIQHEKYQPINELVLNMINESQYQEGKDNFSTLLKQIQDRYGHNSVKKDRLRYLIGKKFPKDWGNAWKKIPAYVEKLNELNIKSKIKYNSIEANKIESIYVEAPYAQQFCHSNCFVKVIFADGTHLKQSHTKATLLVISTITSDHHNLPLAAVISDSENNESYRFLFNESKHLFLDNITLIADQHASIKGQIEDIIPNVNYCPCAHHMIKKYNSKIRRSFFNLINSTNNFLYEKRLEIFKSKYPTVYSAISVNLDSIARVKDAPCRFGLIADSPIESINNSLLSARKLEPLYLIEQFLLISIEHWNRQSDLLEQHRNENYVNHTEGTLQEMRRFKLICHDVENREKFTVEENEDNILFKYSVCFNENMRSCTCKFDKEIGMPCRHIISVSDKYNLRLTNNHFEKFHLRRENLNVFQKLLIELPDPNQCEDNNEISTELVIPRQPGRPVTVKRLRPYYENIYGKRRICPKCGEMGHYSKNCPLNRTHEAVDLFTAVVESEVEINIENFEINENLDIPQPNPNEESNSDSELIEQVENHQTNQAPINIHTRSYYKNFEEPIAHRTRSRTKK